MTRQTWQAPVKDEIVTAKHGAAWLEWPDAQQLQANEDYLRTELAEKVSVFETRYGVHSSELSDALKSGRLRETADVAEWCVAYAALSALGSASTAMSDEDRVALDRPSRMEDSSITELAAQQGVQPLTNLSDLRGEFWPDHEDIDDLGAAVRNWRSEA